MRLSFGAQRGALNFFKAVFWKTGARRRQGFAEGGRWTHHRWTWRDPPCFTASANSSAASRTRPVCRLL